MELHVQQTIAGNQILIVLTEIEHHFKAGPIHLYL